MEHLGDLLGDSPAIDALRESVRKVAQTGSGASRLPTVLITGETGTGKGLVARILHASGPRAEGPFVDVNCAAIPDTLLEAELFGFERGAFTDAHRGKPGLFQMASGGTIFLDEIGLLTEALQAKLLTVLEARSVRRLGATRSEPIDVRVIAATNADLLTAIRERRFREDLFHRLAVVTLAIPPLRERGHDTVVLAERFLARASKDYALPTRVLTREATDRLLTYAWPGNVRELANVIERASLMAESTALTPGDLNLPALATPAPAATSPARTSSLDDVMRAHVHAVLGEHAGNITRAARALGITRTTLRSYIQKFHLQVGPPSERRPAEPGRNTRPPSAASETEQPVLASASPLDRDRSVMSAGTGMPPVPVRWERRLVALLAVSWKAARDADYPPASLFQDLAATVAAFGGRVEEFTPSDMVVAFGIDGSEDAPRRAAYAALATLKLVERGRTPSQPLSIRCAIATSRCLVATGIVSGMDAAAKRETWETLRALLDDAEPGAVMVSAEAAPYLERRFELVRTGRVDAPPTAGFRLVGRERTGLEVGGRTLSRFVGRDHDLAWLHDRLSRVEEGHGQAVAIVGEPGVGKSRLLYELRRSVSAERATVLVGRCLPYGPTTPYLPIIDLVRASVGIDEDADFEAVSARLGAALQTAGLASDDRAPYFLHLLGFKQGTERLVGQSPEVIKKRIVETLKHLCLAISQVRPLICAVEDLHWIDQTSETVLASLVDALSTSRVLLVVTYRSGYQPPWLGASYASQHSLARLTRGESLAVLESILPESTPAMSQHIIARAEGVPLFIEELARAMSERDDEPSMLAVPVTLEGVLTARLDHLAPEDRELLQVASVIGRDFSRHVLAEVSNRPADALERDLGRLRTSEFIFDKGLGEGQAFTFKHSLTHEVTYQTLAASRRRELHAAVAGALERVSPDTATRQPEILAHHLSEAGDSRAALTYWQRAGTLARQRGAYVEAIRQMTRAVELLPAVPEGAERARLELELQVSLGISESALRGFAAPEVRRIHERARELCGDVEAGPLLLAALGGLCQFYYFRGELHAARELAEHHLAAVHRSGAMNRLCASYDALGYIDYHLGALTNARAHLEKSLNLYETIPRPPGTSLTPFDIGVSAQAGLAVVLALAGEAPQARRHAQQAVERAAQLAPQVEALSLAYAHTCASRVHLLWREPEPAAMHARQAIDVGLAHGYVTPVLEGRLDLAMASIAQGDAGTGVDLLRREIEAWEASGYEIDQPYWLSGLVEGHRLQGQTDAALTTVQRALSHVERHRDRIWEPELYRLRAEVTLSSGAAGREAAIADLEHAVKTARDQGARLFELRAETSLQRVRLGPPGTQ